VSNNHYKKLSALNGKIDQQAIKITSLCTVLSNLDRKMATDSLNEQRIYPWLSHNRGLHM